MSVDTWDMRRRHGNTRRRHGNTQTSTKAVGDYETFTREKLLAVLEDIGEMEPDPLNGATVLYVATGDDDAVDKASQLREASGNRVQVLSSPNAFPGRIYGFKGATFMPCLLIKLKDD